MEKRRVNRGNILLRQPPTDDGIDRVEENLAMRENGAFGITGRAGCVENAIRRFQIERRADRFVDLGLLQSEFIIFRPRHLCPTQADKIFDVDLSTHLLHHRNEFRFNDQHLRFKVVDHICQFARGQSPVKRGKDRPDLRQPVEEIDIDNTVFGENGNAVASLNTQLIMHEIRQAVGALIQFSVCKTRACLQLDDRNTFGSQVGSFT